MKHLTPLEMQKTREKAAKLISKRIGPKPTRSAYKREYGPLMSILDVFALVIFAGALAVSSTHIISLMTEQAMNSYKAHEAGLIVSQEVYVLIHQLGMLLAAEAAVILFLVMYRLRKNSLFLLLSLAGACFVIASNVASGLHIALSVLPPMFTIGIGFRLEEIVTEAIRRRQDVDQRYGAALAAWEAGSANPEDHPDYTNALRSEVWATLERKNSFDDMGMVEKRAIADNEINRHSWEATDNQSEAPFGPTQTAGPGSTQPTPNGRKPIEIGSGDALL